VVVVSLVVATCTPLVWELMTPPADAGALPAPTQVTAPPVPPAAVTARHGAPAPEPGAVERRDGSAADDGLRPATRSGRIADLDVEPSPAPRRLRIPSIDVDAKIGAIGVEDDGVMEVPENVRNVGWYRYGPAPGEPGATVIAGHVDSRELGPGAFFDLRTLDVGARVTVTDSAGDEHRYDVVARRTYDKSVLPTDRLFSRAGPSQLVLVTCGGTFDSEAGSYRDNVVIYAQPS
jgi:hypothetical protein